MLSCLRKLVRRGSRSQKKMQPAVVEATAKHTATLIFLHGLGDTGFGWSNTLGKLKPSYFKLICPHAPLRNITVNGGMLMPAWFDSFGHQPNAQQDKEGIANTREQLEKLVDGESAASGISLNRFIIGGFSQGGAAALFTTVTSPKMNIAGVVALSSYLPLLSDFQSSSKMACIRKDMPVFQAHGNFDQMVPLNKGQMTSQFLNDHLKMSDAQFKIYPGLQHSYCDEEMADLYDFLVKVCPRIE